jgi:hypothetical protein
LDLIFFVAPASCRLSRGHLALAREGKPPSGQSTKWPRFKENGFGAGIRGLNYLANPCLPRTKKS